MKELGVCVIGAGDMGRKHAQCWAQIEEARLIAVADPDEQRAAKSRDDHGFEQAFADWREALDQPGIKAVSVCVPSAYHRECAVAAMERGYHVLCEKPLAVREEDALAILHTAETAGVKFAVGFCKRFSNLIRSLRDMVQAGRIGRPVFYRSCSGWEIRFKPWIMDRNLGGGPLVDFACHYFDQWRFIFGSDPIRVKASGLTFSVGAEELPGVEPEVDTATVLVEYDSGDVGMISVSWGLPRGTSSGGLEDLLGPEGVVTVHGFNKLTVKTREGEEVIEGLNNDMYLDQIRAFVAAILEDRPVEAGATDGLLALRLSLAALESIKTGGTVELADLPSQ